MTEKNYVYNYQMDMAFIKSRTAHKVEKRDNYYVKTACGIEIHAEDHAFEDDNSNIREKHKCGRCWRD